MPPTAGTVASGQSRQSPQSIQRAEQKPRDDRQHSAGDGLAPRDSEQLLETTPDSHSHETHCDEGRTCYQAVRQRPLLERWHADVRRRRDWCCGPNRALGRVRIAQQESLESFAVAPRRCACGDAVLRSVALPDREGCPRGGKRTKSPRLWSSRSFTKPCMSRPRRSRWSTRSLAAALGTSPAMVQRVWKTHGLTARQRPSNAAS